MARPNRRGKTTSKGDTTMINRLVCFILGHSWQLKGRKWICTRCGKIHNFYNQRDFEGIKKYMLGIDDWLFRNADYTICNNDCEHCSESEDCDNNENKRIEKKGKRDIKICDGRFN